MSNFREDQQRASQSLSHLVRDGGQKMPSQFAAKPTPANTGLETQMRASLSMARRQQEAHVKQQLRQLESQHKVNRLANAERLVMGKPPIIPRLPLSTGPFIGHNLRDYKSVDWQDGRYVSRSIQAIFNQTGGWGTYYGVGGFGTNNKVGR